MNNMEIPWKIDEIKSFINKQKIEFIYIDKDVKSISEIPYKHCVYIVTTISEKRYIGSSIYVSTRLYQHLSRDFRTTKITEPLKNIEIYVTKNISDIELLEAKLIYVLKPEINVIGKDKEIDVIGNRIYNGFDLLFEHRGDIKKITYGMFIDKRTLTDIKKRNNVMLILNRDNVKEYGFEPGSVVNVIFETGKITLLKEIKGIEM